MSSIPVFPPAAPPASPAPAAPSREAEGAYDPDAFHDAYAEERAETSARDRAAPTDRGADSTARDRADPQQSSPDDGRPSGTAPDGAADAEAPSPPSARNVDALSGQAPAAPPVTGRATAAAAEAPDTASPQAPATDALPDLEKGTAQLPRTGQLPIAEEAAVAVPALPAATTAGASPDDAPAPRLTTAPATAPRTTATATATATTPADIGRTTPGLSVGGTDLTPVDTATGPRPADTARPLAGITPPPAQPQDANAPRPAGVTTSLAADIAGASSAPGAAAALTTAPGEVTETTSPLLRGPDGTLLQGSAPAAVAARPVVAAASLPYPVQQVAEVIRNQTTDNRLSIRLDPPDLGRVTLDLSFDGTRLVSAVVAAESPETLNLLKKSGDGLLKELEQSGFGDVDLDFSDHFTDDGAPESQGPAYGLVSDLRADATEFPVVAGRINIISSDRIDARF